MRIVSPLCVNTKGYQYNVQFNNAFLKPKIHIPPTNPSDGFNLSPIEGKQNCSSLIHEKSLVAH